eukprot:15408034-Alexandrium_andersonii.AAC.1
MSEDKQYRTSWRSGPDPRARLGVRCASRTQLPSEFVVPGAPLCRRDWRAAIQAPNASYLESTLADTGFQLFAQLSKWALP